MNWPAAIAAACSALCMVTPAAAQHQHHGAAALDTLTVRAERDVVQLRNVATVVNARTSAAAGGSIEDLLRTVPGIELDADGRISMRGNGSVQVLLNGRRIPLNGAALAAFLRRMPASSLQRIEAGTAVSAREAADGAGGVLNLVTRDVAGRTSVRSLAASFATDDHYSGSAAATGNVRDVVSWDATYSLSSMRPRIKTRTARSSLVPGDLPLQTQQDSRAHERHSLHSIHAGAAVMPAPNTSLALRGNYSWMKGATQNRSAFVFTNAAGNTGTSTTGSLLEHVIPSAELSAVANVTRGRVRFTSEARTSFVDEDVRGDFADEAGGYSYATRVMTSEQRDHALRHDLGIQFSGISVDVGQASQFRTITAAHDATHFGATASQFFRHESVVHAAYVAAHGFTGNIRAEAGLRVEADRSRIFLDADSAHTAVRLFPSISAAWSEGPGDFAYRLAYGRRISRPSADLLNPFSMGDDHMDEILGNPSLLPEISDQVEFGMERRSARLTLQLTPFLRWTRNPVRPLKTSTAKGGTTTSLYNLIRERAAGADGSVRAQVSDGTVVMFAGSVAHTETIGDPFSSSGVYVTARLTVDMQVAENTTAQLYAYRKSAQPIEQGEILAAFTSELALTQRLADDRARIMLRLSDPLRSDGIEFRIADAQFSQQTRRRTARPLLSLFASWAVGAAPREAVPVRTHDPARIF